MSHVKVKSVRSGSAGELAGLMPDDVLVEVYGVSIRSRSQLIETMADEAKKNDSLFMVIERAGERLELSLPHPTDSLGCVVKDESVVNTEQKSSSGSGRSYALGIIGILALIPGFYFLFYMPSETVNLHRLGIGQTLAIIGALFIAAEWRPQSATRTSLRNANESN